MAGAWKGIVGKPMTLPEFDLYVQDIFRKMGRAQFEWAKFCVVHNTAIPKFSDWHKVAGDVRMHALAHYYQFEAPNTGGRPPGWSAGPHAFIADDFIWPFTPLWLTGVHSPSWNPMAWGIEFVGDYNIEPLNTGVLTNGVGALSVLHRVAGFSPSTIRFHREDPKTTHRGCPGTRISKDLIIRSVSQSLGISMTQQPTSLDPTPSPAVGRPVLKLGAKGAEVAELQSLLGITNLASPGTFGPLTRSRVIAWQQVHGLVADGIVGRATWESLLG